MLETKRELFLFSIKDYTSLKEHFEEMARSGWLLEKVGTFTIKYKKIPPMDLVFSLDIYPEEKFFKSIDKDEVERYKLRLNEAGWNHIVSHNNLQISYSKKEEDLTPIQDNIEIKLQIMERSILVELFGLLFPLLLIYLNLRNIFDSYQNPFYYENLYSNITIILPIILGISFFLGIIYFLSDLLWLLKIRFKKEKAIPRTNYMWGKVKGIIFFLLFIILGISLIISLIWDSVIHSIPLYLIIIPIVLTPLVFMFYNKILKPKKIGRSIEFLIVFILTILLIFLPLYKFIGYFEKDYSEILEEGYIGVTGKDLDIGKVLREKTFTKEGSILVPKKSIYTEYYRGQTISTIYVKSRTSKIARFIFHEMIKTEEEFFKNYRAENLTQDYFDEVYYMSTGVLEDSQGNKLIVLKDDTILYLYTDIDLSENWIMDMINEKIE